jgi:hypothetical protein
VTDSRSRWAPITLWFDGLVGVRLNEHALHTWDIEVTTDPSATILQPVAVVVADNLEMIGRYTARPTGDTSTVTVAATDVERGFTVALTPESVAFTSTAPITSADVELAAEAIARLVRTTEPRAPTAR